MRPAKQVIVDLHQLELSVSALGFFRILRPGHFPAFEPALERGGQSSDLGERLLACESPPTADALAPGLHFARGFVRHYLTAVAARGEAERGAPLPPDLAQLQQFFEALPPLTGGEYATIETLAAAWEALDGVVRRDLSAFKGSVHEYLQRRDSAWHGAGRVTFHLAEQKNNEAAPFAFLATTSEEGTDGRTRHVPLGRALARVDADAADLLRLLRPVHEAAKRSVLVQKLWDSGALHHPLAWGIEDAYAFLLAVPDCEAAGITVRVPNWWRARRAGGVRASARVGSNAPSGMGLAALLDFDAGLTLDGERLSATEERALLAGARGLRLVRGQWVEVDPERLRQAVSLFGTLAERAQRGELGLAEGLRLLAGATDDALDQGSFASHETAVWSGVEAGSWLAELLARLAEPETSAATDPGAVLHGTLRPYQRKGVAWLLLLARLGLGACLADDMGLGKTIQVIALMLVLAREGEHGPHLFVLPTSLLGNWQAELAKFAPTLRVFVAHRSEASAEELAKPKLSSVDVVLTTYGTVGSLAWAQKRAFGLLVLDEAQAIKNAGTRQAKSVKELRARMRIALTGTPVENRLGDLWSLFDFLNPGLLGGPKEFTSFTQRLSADGGPGFAPLRRLLRPYILRRMKTDPGIAPDLPDKTVMQVLCGLSPVQVALYQDTVRELAVTLERADGIERRGLVLASLMRLKQICNHPSHWLGDGAYTPEDSGKFQRLAELCETIRERQERVLVFTQFRELTGALDRFLAERFGRSGLVLHGGTAAKRRADLVAEFQANDGPPYFVLSLKAGGTGLNLTGANHVVHFDRWWNPAVENQATDRAFRIGQRKNVLVHAFTCRGTIEERIDAMLASKRVLSDQLLAGSAENALTELASDELLKLVSLDVHRASV